MAEYTEDCCFNDVRDHCPLRSSAPCSCACHETQVTIHGTYGSGIMPVEFRDALVTLTQLVVEAVDRGELGRPTPPSVAPATRPDSPVTDNACARSGAHEGGVMDDQIVDTLEAEIERLRQQVAAASHRPDLLARLVRPWHSGPSGDQGLNDPLYGTKETTMSNDIPYEYTNEGEVAQEAFEAPERGEHLLQGRIIGVYDRGGKGSHRVANHGIVTCSCGWSSDEQITLIEASRIADEQHPEGRKDHPDY